MTITAETVDQIGDGAYPQTVRALAEKWGKILGVPPSWIVSHAWVETTNHIKGKKAHNERGNAWGVMQMKPPTADDMVERLRRKVQAKGFKGADEVNRVLGFWTGKGEDLFNPELAIMLGAFYLRNLANYFHTTDQKVVAAAYNQGPGAVKIALAEGKFTPKMNEYLARMEEAKSLGFA